MSIKEYLEPFVPADPRLIEMGMTFARNKAIRLQLDITNDPPQRLEEDVRTAMACGIRGLFFKLARGISDIGTPFNITPTDPGMQDIFSAGLFMRLPVETQDQAEAYPLLMAEFRRLADIPDLGLPYGSRLEKGADCIMMLPGSKSPAEPQAALPSTEPRRRARLVKFGKDS